MEDLLNFKDGTLGVLVSLCVILTVQTLVKVGEFLWRLREKKEGATDASIKKLTEIVEKNTAAQEHLAFRFDRMEKTFSAMPKMKEDLRRYYLGLKLVAGKRWDQIKDKIVDDSNSN